MLRIKEIYQLQGHENCLLTLFVLALALLSPTDAFAQQIGTFEQSVVMIQAVHQEYDFASPWKKGPMGRGVGSGFIIEGNRILTNAHNVANHRYLEIKKQNHAQRYQAKVQYVGHDCDLAILTVDDASFFEGMLPLQFGGLPEINSTVQTCGFPVGGQQLSTTEGVVSRLETNTYSHSQASRHLVVQTDAAINPGNSGGPVLQDGKVVGVAFQGLRSGDNIGYMIPTTIISHFLIDIQDQTYDGFGRLGITMFPGLHNAAYKKYLKVPDSANGIVVTEILINSQTKKILKKGDVITKIDVFNIDNDGRIMIDGISLEMTEALDRKQIGDTVTLTYYRDGKQYEEKLTVSNNEQVIPWNRLYDVEPDYRVFAGLTFVQLNRNFLEEWGSSWIADIPFPLRYLFLRSSQLNKNPDRKEYVVLSEILADEVNAYLSGYMNQVVKTVNGIEINSLEDLDTAFSTDKDGYWLITFIDNDAPMVVDAKKARSRQDQILQQYQVPNQ